MTDPARPGRRFRRRTILPWITTPVLIILGILTWQAYVTIAGISSFFLPSPRSVGLAWLEMIQSPRVWAHTQTTAYETLMGFLFGSSIGVCVGVIVGRIPWLETTLNPFIIAIQVVPKVAFVPLFVLWFGYGATSKVIVAAVLAFFPVLTNTVLGVKSVDAGHRDVMTSLNASRLQILRRLELPSSLPYILSGMEVGVVLAIIGAIVGEYLGGNTGLGYLLIGRMNAFETDGVFAVMIQLTGLGFVFYFAIGILRRILIPWHQSTRVLREI